MWLFEFEYIFIHLGICVILLYIYYKTVSSRNYWKARGIPYIKPSFFFGNIKDLILFRKNGSDFYQEIYNQFEGFKYGGIFEFSNPSLIICDKELVEQMLIKDFSSFHDRGIVVDTEYEPLSGTLVNTEGKQWRNLRCKLTPTFTTGKLKSMFEQINNCSNELVKFIDKHLDNGNPFETKILAGRFTTNVIASCAFGLQFETTNDEVSEFQDMVSRAFSKSKLTTARMFFRMTYPKLSKMLNIKMMPQYVETYFINLVKETLRYRKESKVVRNDFLQLLLNLQKQEKNGKDMNVDQTEEYSAEDEVVNQMQFSPEDSNLPTEKVKLFTDESVAAQAFIFLAAGGESASGTISYNLYCISQNSDIQKRLHDEIDTVLKRHEGKWSYQMVKDMAYLDLVMQETFRMYPVSPLIMRKCSKPFKLPDSKAIVEPGSKIAFPVYSLQRDPRYYPDPDKFVPERFIGNNYRPSGCYLPFGDGPRICIAMRFAILEMKVCLAKLLSVYEITTNAKMKTPMEFTKGSIMIETEGGIWLDFHKRKC